MNFVLKDDIDIDFASPLSKKYALENGNTSLRISHVSQGDSASYSCVAKNIVGANTIDFRLNIQTPPKLAEAFKKSNNACDEHGTQLSVRYNTSLSLECPVDSNPKPEISWIEVNTNDQNEASERVTSSIRNVTLARDSYRYHVHHQVINISFSSFNRR